MQRTMIWIAAATLIATPAAAQNEATDANAATVAADNAVAANDAAAMNDMATAPAPEHPASGLGGSSRARRRGTTPPW